MSPRALPAALLAIIAIACGSPRSETEATPAATEAPPVASTTTTPAPAADYDLQFIDTIIQHHEMAVEMGRMAETEASGAALKEFGRKVAQDQAKEIQQLRAWREQWYHAAPKAVNPQLAGAATLNVKMSHAEPATAHELDARIVAMMLPHHQGAIDMAFEALQRAQRRELREFAQQMIDKQQNELQQLQQWKR